MNFARHARGGLLILLPGLALLSTLGCPSGADDAAAEATQAKPVQIVPLGRADIVEVAPRVSGYIVEVAVTNNSLSTKARFCSVAFLKPSVRF